MASAGEGELAGRGFPWERGGSTTGLGSAAANGSAAVGGPRLTAVRDPRRPVDDGQR
jgi:hypothetical protein